MTYSRPKPVVSIATVSISNMSSFDSYIGKSMRLKQVLQRIRNGNEEDERHRRRSKNMVNVGDLLRTRVETGAKGHAMDGKFSDVSIASLQHAETPTGNAGCAGNKL